MSRQSAVRAAHTPDPETVWAALAPALAAGRRMRVSKDGGRKYRRADERYVTDRLPNQPTAVRLYDKSGCASTIGLDLDASEMRGGRDAVARDYAALTRLLDKVGARWFSDHSPNGGRHIYVPLSEPAPFGDAAGFVRSLAARTPTLDPLPMLNITDGCLRPPGARHRSGGHQTLDGSLSAAVDAMHVRTSPQAWRRLLEETATPLATPSLVQVNSVDPTPDMSGEARLEALHGFNAPDASYAHIARTGDWSTEDYKTASHARQAVIWSAVASGWAIVDVARRLSDGTWAGLASMYAKYPARHRHTALVRDWRTAIAFEAGRRRRGNHKSGTQSVRQSTTSPHQSHAGGPGVPNQRSGTNANQQVRVWLAAVDLLTRGADPAVRAVLYALGEAAALTDDLVIEHGNRSLAIATGLDQSSVGRVLKALREAPKDRLLIDLVKEAESTRANVYTLVIPDLLRPACEKKPWRRGKIHAIRPAFRELGLVAAFVYGALEQHDAPVGGRDLAADAGFGHSATYEALAVLSSWGLAEKVKGGWVLGKASLARLAEYFGTDEQVAAQVKKYREERLAWWRYLGLVEGPPPEVLDAPGPGDDLAGMWELLPHSPSPAWQSTPPEQDVVVALADWRRSLDAERAEAQAAAEAAALALLEDVLGATVVRDGAG